MTSFVKTQPNGDKFYYTDNKLHRDNDLPAVERENGTEEWYQNGQRFRADGPVIKKTGSIAQTYMRDGQLHRDGDLPAVIKEDGTEEYYKEGKLHRDGDEPAIIKDNGTQEYYKEGKLHRDGDAPAVVGLFGSVKYYKDGKLHRDGNLGPAVIKEDGTQEWYKDGKLHRDNTAPDYDLPAVISPNNKQEWYKEGKRHRSGDLPAVIWPIAADAYTETQSGHNHGLQDFWYGDGLRFYNTSESANNWSFKAVKQYWEEGQEYIYTIVYDANGSTAGTTPQRTFHYYDVLVAVSANSGNLVRTGFTFINWNTQPDALGTTFNAGSTIQANKKIITLYAKWTYTINYRPNGGSGQYPTSSTHIPNSSATIADNTFNRTGYTFSTWNTNAIGTGTNYAPNSQIDNMTSDITLYAIWTPNP
jgi:uncharacterized repeat protein (TIGR02543 family)